jgi:hypothetical protein
MMENKGMNLRGNRNPVNKQKDQKEEERFTLESLK